MHKIKCNYTQYSINLNRYVHTDKKQKEKKNFEIAK